MVKTEAEGLAADILVELLWDWEMFVVRESKFQNWNTDDKVIFNYIFFCSS